MIEFKKILLFALLLNFASCARILGVFPMASYSHFILGDTILKELAARGHELTVISAFPQEVPLKNRKDIYVHEMKSMVDKEKQDNTLFFEFAQLSSMEKQKRLLRFGYGLAEVTFQNEEVRALINSEEHFDLIVMESFYNEAFFGFGHKFKAPTVIISPGGAFPWINRITGNQSPTSFVVSDILPYTPNMTFFQRFHNTFTAIGIEIVTHLYAIPPQNALMQTYFKDAPHVYDLMYNSSLILMNTYSGFTAPIPLMPNMKEVGGLHVKNNTKLPDDLKKFLDDSKEGVVLFALGSNLKSKDLAPEKLRALMEAFRRWKKPVLWKFEEQNFPGKSNNIKIVKWLPQAAVLAHPNVKAFITHGGRLSTLESIYFGVPIIGFAIFAEQPFNIAQAVHAGYGLEIDFHNFTADDIYNALVEITADPKYGEKAKILSKGMQSRNALEESIHWIEYVVQFKGAPHLRSFGVNLPFYQYLLTDVILFVVVLACIAVIVCAFLISLICCRSKPKRKEKVK